MARAKHRWKHEYNQMVALVRRCERQVAQEKMMEEHRNIKKAGLRSTTVEETENTPVTEQFLIGDRLMVGQKALDLLIQVRILVPKFLHGKH